MTKSSRRLAAVAVAGLAYLAAVTQRTTMGSVALDAADRFDTSAQQLASLSVLQLIFYAGMQIPVGIMLDRLGSRKILAAGAFLMASGQFLVAFAPNLSIAVLGRILVGIGDACTFISMMRLANSWYTGRFASQLQQWLATFGQSGQILSAIPFALLLHTAGWVPAFVSAAGVSVLTGTLIWIIAKENPATTSVEVIRFSTVIANLKKNLKVPVTWLAFFTHFSTQATGTTFALLWGVPFMISALGLARAEAGGFLTLFVVTNAAMGPVIGLFCARYPWHRQLFVLTLVTSIVLGWLTLVLYPGTTPLWLLGSLVVLIGIGGPASMVAFDYSKESFPPAELGVTNGLINVGGFLASLVMMWLIGFCLDSLGGDVVYSLENFRVAFALQLIVSLVGIAGLILSGRVIRNKLHSN
jgi:MFS family permease